MTDLERLERIRQVTPYFVYWQGLKLLPAGAVMLAMIPLLYIGPNTALFWTLYLTLVVVGSLVYRMVSANYQQLFGKVQNSKINRRVDKLTVYVWIPLLIGVFVFDAFSNWPLALTGLAYAVFFIWSQQITGGGRNHYLWAAGLYLLFTFSPLLGFDTETRWTLFITISGVVMIVTGILDHLELMRIFRPIKDDGLAS